MEHKNRNNRIGNKGMSLIELIIVVAIIALFSGIVTYSMSWASGKAAEECTQKLAYSLQQARTMAMGKNNVTVTVKKNSAGEIVTEVTITADTESGPSTNTTTSRVGKKSVAVKFSDGSSESELSESGVK